MIKKILYIYETIKTINNKLNTELERRDKWEKNQESMLFNKTVECDKQQKIIIELKDALNIKEKILHDYEQEIANYDLFDIKDYKAKLKAEKGRSGGLIAKNNQLQKENETLIIINKKMQEEITELKKTKYRVTKFPPEEPPKQKMKPKIKVLNSSVNAMLKNKNSKVETEIERNEKK